MATYIPSQQRLERTLHAMFVLARSGQPATITRLRRWTGDSALRTAQALLSLERAGLVDASRARLTMAGLAVAVCIARQAAVDPADAGIPSAPVARRAAPDDTAPQRPGMLSVPPSPLNAYRSTKSSTGQEKVGRLL
jgi:hypothetical protein